MKVILYAAITTNGLVAGKEDDTSWTSKEEWDSFRKVILDCGNVVIGRRTYELMRESNELIEGAFHVVVTSTPEKFTDSQNVIFVDSPQEALSRLRGKDFDSACVSGGGELNGSFLKENLVDEIYLDIEPIALGKGIPLFVADDFKQKLELLEVKNLSPQTVQLHYKVLK
jgi:dihydrofolate reductase